MLSRYPNISGSEFAEACQTLEERCHDNLNGTNWVSVQWHNNELRIKQVKGSKDHASRSSMDGGEDCDARDSEATLVSGTGSGSESDTDAIVSRHGATPLKDRPAVDFSILLSPSYGVPVLWFTLSSGKVARIQDLEEIYSRVVAPGSHEQLKGIGIMGGISLANHPITDTPTFSIHPCNTPEAMAALNDGSNLDPFQYLLLWFGVVGTGVGLHVPGKVALKPTN